MNTHYLAKPFGGAMEMRFGFGFLKLRSWQLHFGPKLGGTPQGVSKILIKSGFPLTKSGFPSKSAIYWPLTINLKLGTRSYNHVELVYKKLHHRSTYIGFYGHQNKAYVLKIVVQMRIPYEHIMQSELILFDFLTMKSTQLWECLQARIFLISWNAFGFEFNTLSDEVI